MKKLENSFNVIRTNIWNWNLPGFVRIFDRNYENKRSLLSVWLWYYRDIHTLISILHKHGIKPNIIKYISVHSVWATNFSLQSRKYLYHSLPRIPSCVRQISIKNILEFFSCSEITREVCLCSQIGSWKIFFEKMRVRIANMLLLSRSK